MLAYPTTQDVIAVLVDRYNLPEHVAFRYTYRWRAEMGSGNSTIFRCGLSACALAVLVWRHHERWLAGQVMGPQVVNALIYGHGVSVFEARRLMRDWARVAGVTNWNRLRGVETPESLAELIAGTPPRDREGGSDGGDLRADP